jgi:hypothetical protein
MNLLLSLGIVVLFLAGGLGTRSSLSLKRISSELREIANQGLSLDMPFNTSLDEVMGWISAIVCYMSYAISICLSLTLLSASLCLPLPPSASPSLSLLVFHHHIPSLSHTHTVRSAPLPPQKQPPRVALLLHRHGRLPLRRRSLPRAHKATQRLPQQSPSYLRMHTFRPLGGQ